MNGIDASVLHTLYALRDPILVQTFVWITALGSTIVIGGIALSAGVWLLYRAQLSYFAGLCVSVLGTIPVVFVLKELIGRTRPDSLYQAYLETGFSLPSGHAAFSLALYGYLAYLAWKHAGSPLGRYIVLTATFLLVVLIGFSRLYLGLHYASDVLGGYAVAAVFLALGILVSERLTRSPKWS